MPSKVEDAPKSTNDVEHMEIETPKTAKPVTKDPKSKPVFIKDSITKLSTLKYQTSTLPRRRSPKHRTWADLSLVDDKGLLDTFTNQKNNSSTGTPRKRLPRCKWVKLREPELNVLMPAWKGSMPKLILTDPEGRYWTLDDKRIQILVQRALPELGLGH